MRYLGPNGGWHELATACLKNAIKTADVECVHHKVFSMLCGLAGQDENDVIVELKYAEEQKKLYGDKWYRRGMK